MWDIYDGKVKEKTKVFHSEERKMKKKILLGVVLGTIMLFMTGCCMQHEWVTADCVVPQTCNKCGKTEGDALGHKWEDATCASAKTCTVCGKTEGDALDHKWEDATCTDAKTCTACGKTEGNALGHRMQLATCTSAKTCKLCGKTEGEALGHKWQAATCVMPEKCTRCKQTRGSTVGHELDSEGICTICKKQIGIKLTMQNYKQYLDVSSTVTSTNSDMTIYTTVLSKKSGTKFYNAKIYVGYIDKHYRTDIIASRTKETIYAEVTTSYTVELSTNGSGSGKVNTKRSSQSSLGTWKTLYSDRRLALRSSDGVSSVSGYVVVE